MAKHLMRGRQAENIAKQYFIRYCYQITHRNFRYGFSEIDLIVQKNNLLIFVEVKSKSAIDFGEPEKNIRPAQIKRIKIAAEAFLVMANWEKDIRFDTILLTFFPQAIKIEHFKDAFS
jgi:putative endonuclease